MQAVFHAEAASFLGRGAFGETWRVVDSAGTSTAVKIILDEGYPQALLTREVGGLQRAQDPRVVALLDVREVELAIGARQALVFEFVAGGDVAGRLAAGAGPSWDEAAQFLRELLGAVNALHAVDTVHRDIKPENVALRGSSWSAPVLLDLGLAKLLNVESMTQYPALMGTLPYMAPEQVQQESGRKAADVWAVGVVSYILLSGRHPFLGGRSTAVLGEELLDRMRAGAPPLPAGVPGDAAAVVHRLLSFDAFERGSAGRAYRDLGGT
ncbi:Protein kinase domain-containing protein [Klenkia soli]|uniref:Protein kinase domain-containing protein n=1 Tax=Klenkia soli TaxID=1052260 RepID=A0A1H0ISD3_9ACTN|nr:serine/threonine-protein kinase [Klenkia soli]SDO34180.1 Protein kinase domain-containing protein [Klenkia soli]